MKLATAIGPNIEYTACHVFLLVVGPCALLVTSAALPVLRDLSEVDIRPTRRAVSPAHDGERRQQVQHPRTVHSALGHD